VGPIGIGKRRKVRYIAIGSTMVVLQDAASGHAFGKDESMNTGHGLFLDKNNEERVAPSEKALAVSLYHHSD
jgi:hypothetical protein